ncbi:hypothetical protein A2Z67_00125 [Candidatus Woesebacteria bacterium RBG_13_36_22]|uniref:Uncharacterized protein n=1 Tax=Candidatus Woesebacteria bacterium RBG_13_36_22 TaxID=1802478 RepID=A0A1F7X6J8_9BACT|nr:MAG: hypothetical protein A2Z67_00125 [Candidatus Woesebacteria bacterium RBG_13_36_22]
MKITLENMKTIVRLKYPDAHESEVPLLLISKRGKWFHIISSRRCSWLGQGSTVRRAWQSAAELVMAGF